MSSYLRALDLNIVLTSRGAQTIFSLPWCKGRAAISFLHFFLCVLLVSGLGSCLPWRPLNALTLLVSTPRHHRLCGQHWKTPLSTLWWWCDLKLMCLCALVCSTPMFSVSSHLWLPRCPGRGSSRLSPPPQCWTILLDSAQWKSHCAALSWAWPQKYHLHI